jgi:hypothetical protein
LDVHLHIREFGAFSSEAETGSREENASKGNLELGSDSTRTEKL